MRKSAVAIWIRRGALVALATSTMVLAACGGGGGGGKTAGVTPPPPTGNDPSGNSIPTITGAPASQITVGAAYKLTPVARDADGDTLAFSIQNRPSWATFSTATGELTGTPGAAGTFADIVISVSDGKGTASLPTFTITVGGGTPVASGSGVVLSWDVPTQADDGSQIVNLSGYRIHYGTTKDALSRSVEIPSAGIVNHVIEDLPAGTYYFAVRAITEDGNQSQLSNVVTQVIG
jgi:hypothetical protein